MEPSKRIAPFLKESIFEEMRVLVASGKVQNLCSGYAEWDTPQFLKDFLYQSTMEKENHYGRIGGQPLLIKALAKEYSAKFNREINPEKEIVITHGATGALTNACCAFLNEGDEVVVLEPGFESYFVQPVLFGGKLRLYPLNPPQEGSDEWTIDFEEFEKLFNEKSRMLILNTPHNPTGKVLKEHEVLKIIEIVKKWPRVIIVTDEVYEYMCYNGNQHIRIGAYEDMWDRVISMYSASKTFSISGWRVGWAISSAKLIEVLTAAQTWLNLGINRPTQLAVAKGVEYVASVPFNGDKYYYDWLTNILQRKKDRFVKILRDSWLKIRVFDPEGGFFILADITEMIPSIPLKYFYKKEVPEEINGTLHADKELKDADYSPDYAFVRWFADNYKLLCIPCFPFYDQSQAQNVNEYKGRNFVRFALCKTDETLDIVAEVLTKR